MIFRMADITDWKVAKELLRPAFFKFGMDKLEDYYQPIRLGIAKLWVVENENEMIAAMITLIENAANGKILSIRSLGGKSFRKWSKQMDEILTDYAITNGCYQAHSLTRPGFSRFVPSFKDQGLRLFIKEF